MCIYIYTHTYASMGRPAEASRSATAAPDRAPAPRRGQPGARRSYVFKLLVVLLALLLLLFVFVIRRVPFGSGSLRSHRRVPCGHAHAHAVAQARARARADTHDLYEEFTRLARD